jgi:hypothetical protein
MKKLNFILLTLFFLVYSSHQILGQANKTESFSVNFGPEIVFPEGGFTKSHHTGFGASIKGEYTFGKHASATLNGGLYTFKGKSFINATTQLQEKYSSILAIPIRVGGRYYLGSFYFLSETGVVFVQTNGNTTNAIFTAGLGDKIKIGYNKLDVSLRQEIWFNKPKNFNMAVLRIAYEIVWH